MALYIVDTNFFIQSHRITYPLDIAINFWNVVKKLAASNTIISIDKVKNEIFENDDDLTNWIKKNIRDEFFKSTEDASVLSQYQNVVEWAASKQNFYLPKAFNEFLEHKNADAWIISYALTLKENCTIITQEKSEPNRKSKIKIPDVCNAFNLPYKNTIEMFRELGETF